MAPPSMPRKRSSPIQSSPSPEAPRQVLPRTKAPRAYSNPTNSSGIARPTTASHSQSHPLLMNGQAPAKEWTEAGAESSGDAVISPGTSALGAGSAEMVSGAIPALTSATILATSARGSGGGVIAGGDAYTPPISVPSLTTGPSAPNTATTAPLKKDRSNSGSSTGTSGLGSLLAPMSTGTGASTGPTPPPAEVPQTGLGKMAAAAKARAEGLPARRNSDVQGQVEIQDEDHPLSDTSLKSRFVPRRRAKKDVSGGVC